MTKIGEEMLKVGISKANQIVTGHWNDVQNITL